MKFVNISWLLIRPYGGLQLTVFMLLYCIQHIAGEIQCYFETVTVVYQASPSCFYSTYVWVLYIYMYMLYYCVDVSLVPTSLHEIGRLSGLRNLPDCYVQVLKEIHLWQSRRIL